MQYNEEEKARIRAMIAALEAAKSLLPEYVRRGSGICAAINRLEARSAISISAYCDTKSLIKRALQGAPWLEEWQRRHSRTAHWYSRVETRLRNRQLWIDKMVGDLRTYL